MGGVHYKLVGELLVGDTFTTGAAPHEALTLVCGVDVRRGCYYLHTRTARRVGDHLELSDVVPATKGISARNEMRFRVICNLDAN